MSFTLKQRNYKLKSERIKCRHFSEVDFIRQVEDERIKSSRIPGMSGREREKKKKKNIILSKKSCDFIYINFLSTMLLE